MHKTRSGMLLFLIVFLTAGFSVSMAQPDRLTDKTFSTRSEVIASNGMVATSQPLAAQVGLQILKKGGSAVDAAIATNAALGLMEPTGNGIGGDLFAIVWDASGEKLHGLNASGRSPQNLSYEQLKKELDDRGRDKIPPYGVLPITVPGAVDGWFELHQRFGDLSMQEILDPAIRYARSGFPVSPLISYYWRIGLRIHGDRPGAFKETFSIDGKGPQKGDLFKNPDLADTYELLANKGREAFYEGRVAEKIDQFMRDNGGYLRKKDFEDHESTWVDPVSVNYRGYDVYELPPNGQGIAALQMLQMLEEYDLSSMGVQSTEALHRMIEVKKRVFEDRAKYYADPAFSDSPVEKLISKS